MWKPEDNLGHCPSGVIYLVLWTVSLIDLGLTYQAMLPDQPSKDASVSGYKYTSPCLAFLCEFLGPCAHTASILLTESPLQYGLD